MTTKCTFVSVWDGGVCIESPAELDETTGEICAASVDVTLLEDEPDILEREYLEMPDGEEKEVCPVCHEFILKTVMEEDKVGHGLSEVQRCSSPHCDGQNQPYHRS